MTVKRKNQWRKTEMFNKIGKVSLSIERLFRVDLEFFPERQMTSEEYLFASILARAVGDLTYKPHSVIYQDAKRWFSGKSAEKEPVSFQDCCDILQISTTRVLLLIQTLTPGEINEVGRTRRLRGLV